MNDMVLATLVDQRDNLLALLDEPPAERPHPFSYVTRFGTDQYGFAAAYPDLDGLLGCNECGASRFNPAIHIE